MLCHSLLYANMLFLSVAWFADLTLAYPVFSFSIEFDRDCDYFAIAGVTKKIKVSLIIWSLSNSNWHDFWFRKHYLATLEQIRNYRRSCLLVCHLVLSTERLEQGNSASWPRCQDYMNEWGIISGVFCMVFEWRHYFAGRDSSYLKDTWNLQTPIISLFSVEYMVNKPERTHSKVYVAISLNTITLMSEKSINDDTGFDCTGWQTEEQRSRTNAYYLMCCIGGCRYLSMIQW